MRSLLLSSLLVCAAVMSAAAADRGTHLFILSGQSNMAGLDPELSFVPAVVEAFGQENVVVVKDALGGQPIRRWYKDWKPAKGYDEEATGYPIDKKGKSRGDLYARLMEKVNKASAGKEFNTVTFAWMQGERDAKESHGEVYAASLRSLIDQLAKDLGREDLNFVIGRLSDFDMANEVYPHWTVVREAQVEVAERDPRGDWVDTDDLNDGLNKAGKEIRDNLHYSVEGYETFGKRLAEKSIGLIQGRTQPVSDAPGVAHKSVAGGAPVIRLWTVDQIGGEQNRLKEESEDRGGGKVTYRNIKDPTMIVHQVEGAKPTPAVVYCPGGSYKQVSVRQDYIEWLNRIGLTVFTLKYTVPDDREAAFKDVQRALRMVRHQADQWNIDPGQVGVVGSSAGGHLVARLSKHHGAAAYPAFDPADERSCEPNFVIVTSGAYFATERGGSDLAEEFRVQGQTAPTLLIYAKDDKSFIDGGLAYEKALKASGSSVRLLLFEEGGHGLRGVNWHPECREWLDELGIDLK